MMTQAAQLCQKYKMIILFPIRSSLAKKKGGGKLKEVPLLWNAYVRESYGQVLA